MNTKQRKLHLVELIKNSPDISNKINVTTKLYPNTNDSKDELVKEGQRKTTIFITYAGKNYLKNANVYGTYNAFTIFIFSKILKDDSEDPLDIEFLLDKVTNILYANGYELFEDAVTPVVNKTTHLYEAVIIAGYQYAFPN